MPRESSSTFLGNYALFQKIGTGAHAQVYLAQGRRGSATEEVAVKLADSRCLMARRAAYSEVCLRTHIGHHPNCVQMWESFFDDYLCYIVMERCTQTLADYLLDFEELSERAIAKVFSQILQGVSHIHSCRVMHRDIKPTNILVGGREKRTVKLTDFGVSKYVPEGSLEGKPVGSPAYMCPEMLQHGKYDMKADIWACGVVAYLFLCGRFPYTSQDGSAQGMRTAIAQRSSPDWNKPWLSKEAIAFLTALLERDPDGRASADVAIAMSFVTGDVEMQAGRILPERVTRSLRKKLAGKHDFEQVSPVDLILKTLKTDSIESSTKIVSQRHIDEFLEAEADLNKVDQLVESFWSPAGVLKENPDDGQTTESTTCHSSSSSNSSTTNRS